MIMKVLTFAKVYFDECKDIFIPQEDPSVAHLQASTMQFHFLLTKDNVKSIYNTAAAFLLFLPFFNLFIQLEYKRCDVFIKPLRVLNLRTSGHNQHNCGARHMLSQMVQ